MTRRLLTAALSTLLLVLASLWVAGPAQAWGNHDHCKGHTYVGHTNRWTPFTSHHMDVNLHGCYTIGTRTVPPHLIWTKRPNITYPDAFPGGSILESVSTSHAPFVSSTTRSNGVVTKVKYKWTVKQCSLIKVVLCNHFDFTVAYALRGSHICFAGGACDAWKNW